MQEEQKNNQDLHKCKECGLHYKDSHMAEKCEAWCKEHKTCNLDIIKESEEDKKIVSDKFKEVEKKCEEYLNNWKRSAADLINYKKDEMERISAMAQYAKIDTIFKILPILDNFYLAEKGLSENPQDDAWTKGFLQIHKQIEEFLKKEGIEVIKTVGEKFNPETMDAIGEVEVEGSEKGIIVEELQNGYMINGKVLRPAKVKVSK